MKTTDKIALFPIWLLAHLPIQVLHFIAWILYFITFYIVGYRKKVVLDNLRNSFPQKSDKEIYGITKRFYLHLMDIFLESIYILKMKPKEIIKRYTIENKEIFEDLYAKGKEIVCVWGHFANWEWSASGWMQMPHHLIGIYKPLTNRLFDRLFIYLRSKYGVEVTPLKNAYRAGVNCRRSGDKFAMLLIADQRPAQHEIKLWVDFLNQETPAIMGPEKMAKKFDAAVVFLDVRPVKRSYYKVYPIVLFEDTKDLKEFEITKKFFKTLEEQIKKRPEYYLWSHKRWKYKREDIEKKHFQDLEHSSQN